MTSERLGVALIAALAVGLSACGRSDDSASSTVTVTRDAAPGHAEYVAEADAFCAETVSGSEVPQSLAELRTIPESSPTFPARAAEHFRLVLDVAVGARAELEAIEPPEADRPRVEDFLSANDEAIEALRALIAALDRGETAREVTEDYISSLAEADRIAEAIGFEVCGRTRLG